MGHKRLDAARGEVKASGHAGGSSVSFFYLELFVSVMVMNEGIHVHADLVGHGCADGP